MKFGKTEVAEAFQLADRLTDATGSCDIFFIFLVSESGNLKYGQGT